MMLSEHFSLKELAHTNHKIENFPSAEEIKRLRVLAEDVLEPIREEFGPIRVTSGFRCKELNSKIGGAKDSAHLYGCAADIQSIEGFSPTEIVQFVVDSHIEYDQVIDEKSGNSAWVHIGMLRPGHSRPRKEALVMRDGEYRFFVGN